MPFTVVPGGASASPAASFAAATEADEVTRISPPAYDRQPLPERRAPHVAQLSEIPSRSSEISSHPVAQEQSANPADAAGATFNSHSSSLKPAHARLVIERGRSAGKGFVITEAEVHIGRWDADGGIFPDIDLDADDPEAKVSRRHARILSRTDGYYIEDLGSTNGTFVNRGRRLLPGALQPLRDGDEIIVGKTFLRLNIIK